jgi:hypothetical protein
MHCPQCGQQQASNEMRFCSRCGFPLGGVVELLARGGIPSSSNAEPQEQSLSPRYKGVRQGVIMMLIGTVIVPILAIINSYQIQTTLLDVLVPLSAVILFAGGLMRILYAAIFEQGSMKRDAPAYAVPIVPPQLSATERVSALPPARSIPVSDFAPRRMNTAELVQPHSVTENTTKLLDEEKGTRSE